MHPSAPGVATNPDFENPRGSEANAYAYAREHGVSHALYSVVRSLATAALRTWFWVHIAGRAHIPADGPGIIAPNHKSSLDAGRLAFETGALTIPAAITGTSQLWRAALPKVRRVQLTFLPAVQAEPTGEGEAVRKLIDERDSWAGRSQTRSGRSGGLDAPPGARPSLACLAGGITFQGG
jgi:hypothetical protein